MPVGLELRVGLSPYKQMNLTCFGSYVKGDRGCEPGVELEVLSIVAALMNYTMRIVNVSEGYGCGWKTENGSWNGLLGMLERGEIDVTGNLCTLESDRIGVEAFEPSWPVLQYKQGFLIKKPSVEYKFDITAPFRIYAWLALASIAVLFILSNCLILRWTNRIEKIDFATIFTSAFRLLNISVSNYDADPTPGPFWLMWIICFAFTYVIYGAYIMVVVLNPVVKYRPFNNQLDLAESLLAGDYRLLDYHRDAAALPQCYSEKTCEKFRTALSRHGYEIAIGDGDYGLGQLIASDDSKRLVVVNSMYWLELYADAFAGRRYDLWLIEDDLSRAKFHSYFRRKDAKFRRRFDVALIGMSTFKVHLPEMYVGMARHVFRGRRFRGEFLETYTINLRLISGPMKCYAVGMILAIMSFCFEKAIRWRPHRRRTVILGC